MARITYNKLVRDRIPEYVRAKGITVAAHTIAPEERLPALLKKVREEAAELQSAKREKMAEEIADLLELLQAIAVHAQIPWDDVAKQQESKPY